MLGVSLSLYIYIYRDIHIFQDDKVQCSCSLKYDKLH